MQQFGPERVTKYARAKALYDRTDCGIRIACLGRGPHSEKHNTLSAVQDVCSGCLGVWIPMYDILDCHARDRRQALAGARIAKLCHS